MDIELMAATITTIVAPFTPFLVEIGKEGSKKLAEKISEKGGEEAWKTAQQLWSKIQSKMGNDPQLQGAALMVSADPNNVTFQTMLTTTLANYLKENPYLAQEISDLLGGQDAIQRVFSDRKSWISDVRQEVNGEGEQVVKADLNSRIKGVVQIKK